MPVGAGEGEYWRRVLAHGLEGGLTGVPTRFFHVIRESKAAGGAAVLVDALCQVLRIAAGRLEVSEWQSDGHGVQRCSLSMRQHFARRYANDSLGGADLQASEHLDVVRSGFNSPFWPFVPVTTSIGQEGLDFHSVVYWNLPSNPVDLEQREGRVHRYHGHAIRKNIAQATGSDVIDEARAATAHAQPINPWDTAYGIADGKFACDDGLVPHWVFTGGDVRIRHRCPILPLSRDVDRVEALRRLLAVYRMVFGQPRQDDPLGFILHEVSDDHRERLAKALTIDPSPPSRYCGCWHLSLTTTTRSEDLTEAKDSAFSPVQSGTLRIFTATLIQEPMPNRLSSVNRIDCPPSPSNVRQHLRVNKILFQLFVPRA